MKPWLSEPRGRQLEAFVGVWDIKTSRYATTAELISDACKLFGICAPTFWGVEETAAAIEALGKKERAAIARKNRHLIAVDDDGPAKAVDAPITAEGLQKMMAASGPQPVPGEGQDCVGELDIDPARLLRKVVSAVISAGQGHILYEFPELLEFMGSRIPSRSEVDHLHNIDERMFEAKGKWPNLDKEAWQ
ncbi:hypothetical protein GOD68_18110 [Sinorhizobium medicae]|nr:hypothetical protein [Sinorhizobium medicae]